MKNLIQEFHEILIVTVYKTFCVFPWAWKLRKSIYIFLSGFSLTDTRDSWQRIGDNHFFSWISIHLLKFNHSLLEVYHLLLQLLEWWMMRVILFILHLFSFSPMKLAGGVRLNFELLQGDLVYIWTHNFSLRGRISQAIKDGTVIAFFDCVCCL